MVLSLIMLLYRIARPHDALLDDVDAAGGTVYRGVADKATAAEALETLDADLERIGADLWIARANAPLRELLTATGLMKQLGAEHIFPSVRAAVVAYQAQSGAA